MSSIHVHVSNGAAKVNSRDFYQTDFTSCITPPLLLLMLMCYYQLNITAVTVLLISLCMTWKQITLGWHWESPKYNYSVYMR